VDDDALDPELARLAALRSYGVPGAARPGLDGIVQAAARVTGRPMALVTLLDAEQAWFPARCGVDVEQSDPEATFCVHAVRAGAELEVPDARLDPRFRDNPAVTGPLSVRSYAGFPLRSPQGPVLGTLCVVGDQPGTLDDAQRVVLRVLAEQVVAQLELRRLLDRQTALAQALEDSTASLTRSEQQHRTLFERSPVGQVDTDGEGRLLHVNAAFARLLGCAEPAALVGRPLAELTVPQERDAQAADLARLRDGTTALLRAERTLQRLDGGQVEVALHLALVRDPDGHRDRAHDRVVVTVVDSTERNAARRDLQALNVDLAEREAFTRVLLDTAETPIIACDAAGRPTYANRATRELYGLPDAAGQDPAGELTAALAGAAARGCGAYAPDATTPLGRDRFPVVRALTEGPVRGAELVVRSQDGGVRTLLVNANPFHGPDGVLLGAVAASHDVTMLRDRERALVVSQARFRAAFEHGPMPMAGLDQDGVLREVNPALRRLLSVPSSRLLGTALVGRVHGDDAALLVRALAAAAGGTAAPVEARFLRADGTSVWCEVAANRVPDGAGPDAVLVQLADVTERKRQQQVLEARARRDPLTGLSNREALSVLLSESLVPDGAEVAGTALLFVDLDRFKEVNDTYGHEAGDAVLVEVARRLTDTVRAWDTVLRYGGDEFVVVCRDPKDPVLAGSALAERLRQVISSPFVHAGVEHVVGASIGVATAAPGEDLAAVLARADEQMYRLKRSGRQVPRPRRTSAVASAR